MLFYLMLLTSMSAHDISHNTGLSTGLLMLMLCMLFCSQNKLGKINKFELRLKPQNEKQERKGNSALGNKRNHPQSDGLKGFVSNFCHGKRNRKEYFSKNIA